MSRKFPVVLAAMFALSFPLFAQDAEQIYPSQVKDPGEEVALVPSPDVLVDETPHLWFVELSGSPTADGASLSAVRAEKSAFRNAAKKAGVVYKERYAFDVLFNGLSIDAPATELSKISRIAGVKNVWPVVTETLPPYTKEAAADLYTALAQTGADIAQSSLGLTGTGVRVAVMDTGIDYNHPDLGGCFGPTCRVAYGYDLVGDAFNADPTSPSYNPAATPDNDPDDCGGHGSHVAGIIGANGVVKGVAPGVTFGAYRVFGCNGSTTSDIMVAAMERVLADNMQVLNMSIGSSFQWPEYPTAKAATRLVNKGVSVVASIGNSGTSGLYAAGAPGVGDKVIGIASFDNTHLRLRILRITPDNRGIGFFAATGAPAPPTSGTFPMARTGTTSSTADACNALSAGSLTGKVVLIRRGTCTFNTKAFNAQNAGAAGVVLYNNAAGTLNPTVTGPPHITIPVVAIDVTQGAVINSRLAAGSVDMTWTAEMASFPSSTGNLISSFSSYGLAADLSLKPDIGAPGGNIYSTYPVERGGYATLSGTSMASPHTAGAVALLLESKPRTPANAVNAILQNSASPKAWWGNPASGLLDNVHRQGAGMLQIDKSILATTRVEPSKLSLGESQNGPSIRSISITNNSASSRTYTLTNVAALATGPNTFTQSFFNAPAAVAYSVAGVPASSVVVPAGGSVSVDVTITVNSGLADGSLYGGYLVFTSDLGSTLRVPYSGFKGDYQAVQVLKPTSNGFPWLARIVGPSYAKQVEGVTYTMQGGDIPFVLAHLDHQARTFRVEVLEAASGKNWHRAYEGQYIGRNSTSTGFFAFPFDGTTTAGNKMHDVPNGTYVLRVSVLKALGDASNPAHWETWTSPSLVIARP